MCILLLIPVIVYEILYFLLNASGSHFLLLLFELPLAAACIEARFGKFPRVKTSCSIFRISVYSLTAVFLTGYIIIISDSMYQGWFKLLITGKPNGIVSFIFSFTTGFLASLGCSWILQWKHKSQALVSMLLLVNLVMLILFPGIFTILPFCILLGLYIFILLPKPGRGRLIQYGLLIVAFSAAISWLPPIRNPNAKGSAVVDNASRILRTTLLNILPHLPLTYNVPGYGHPYANSRFTGARPYLTSHVLFVVEAERGTGLYLKTDISYFFNGTAWIIDESVRLIDPVKSIDELPQALLNTNQDISLTVVTDLFPKIPVTQDTYAVRAGDYIYPLPSDSMVEPPDGIPLGKGESVTLFTNRAIAVDGSLVDPGQFSRALQLPSDTMKTFSLLSQTLRGDTDGETLRNIRKYLTDGFIYTLETTANPDPIANFLFETKEGYCVHFSSAAAILARMNYIPVRIAKGFMTVIPREEEQDMYDQFMYQGGMPGTLGTSHITGFSSHQWPEVFIEGRGWVPWEVTPPLIGLAENSLNAFTADDEATRTQLEYFGVLAPSGEAEIFGSGKLLFPGKWEIFLIVLLAVSFAVILYIFLPRIRPLDVQINRSIKRLVRRTAKKRFVSTPGLIGWQFWGHKVSQSLYEDTASVQEMVTGLLTHYYNPQGLPKNEKAALLRIIHRLYRIIRRSRK